MIRHTVAFTLTHDEGSPAEKEFLSDALALASIPAVKKFERLKQVSSKNRFKFDFSMEFDDQPAYQAYNVHPVHVAFVRERWIKEVADFLETDYVAL